MMNNRTYRTVASGDRIEGTRLSVFRRSRQAFEEVEITIYADSLIDVCGDLLRLDDAIADIEAGRVTRKLEDGRSPSGGGLSWAVTRGDLITEILDAIAVLNGQPTSEDRCLRALRDYAADPNEQRRRAFASAYEAIIDQKYFLYHWDPRVSWLLWAVLTLEVGEVFGLEPVGQLFTNERLKVTNRPITAEDHADALAVVRDALAHGQP